MAEEDKELETRKILRRSYDVESKVYEKIYKSYSYDALESDSEATTHIENVVDLFLKDGKIEKGDFLNAAPTLFDYQPSVGQYDSARKEVLRINAELLNDTIFDDIFLEESEPKRKYYKNEHYFVLYHYLSRYWAVRERADSVISPDTELAICYQNICLSVEAIFALQGKPLAEADNFIKNKLNHLKPKIANRYGYFLDKEEEEQDSDYTIKLLRRANAIRLCWLWDRLVIEQYIGLAHDLLLPVTIFASYVSFGLYLFLASIHITGTLGAYFDALANQERLDIEAKKVAWAHLKLRKDVIINDLIWGLANLACVFWLTGFGLYANIGDLLTGLLLVMDLSMSIWNYKDEKREYENDIKGYNEQINTLENRIKSENKKDKLEILKWQLKAVRDKKENRYNAWQDKKLSLYSNIFYAAILVVAFSAFCGFYLSFFPITLPMSIALMGGMMLAASTVLWRSANSYIECRAIDRKKNQARNDYNELISDFIDNQNTLTKNQKKQLCLKIMQKGAQIIYQEDKLLYKRLETLRETANRLIIPGAIVLNFLFLPASVVGVPTYVFLLLGIGIAAVAVSMYIKKYYSPKATKWLDENGEKRRNPSISGDDFAKFRDLLLNEGTTEDKSKQLLQLIKDHRADDKKILPHKSGLLKRKDSGSSEEEDDDNDNPSVPLLGKKNM